MKFFVPVIEIRHQTSLYIVEAKTPEEAEQKALRGDFLSDHSEPTFEVNQRIRNADEIEPFYEEESLIENVF